LVDLFIESKPLEFIFKACKNLMVNVFSQACIRVLVAPFGLFFFSALISSGGLAQNPIHVTYLWHMHQPIYYPYETVTETDNNNRFNFSVRGVHDSRTGAYGEWPKNAVQQGTDLPHAGVQVSFSGSLMENMTGLYGNGWRDHYRWGRNGLRTTRNNPRLDLVGIAYHHSLMPLTTKEAMRMQVRLHKEAYKDVWNSGGSYSKGFWPPECAFDVNMIPALVDEGIEWVIVDNGHFDRACQGFPWSPASSIRPNKADQLNPDPATLGSQWVQLNNIWAPTKVSAPWGYQPRYVQYVDPNSSPSNPIVRRIIAVPAGRYEGNENARGGYGAFKPENVWGQHVSVNTNAQRPMLILCHSDGDNFGMLNADAYNGQHGSFLQMTRTNPNFRHTSVQDYLELYPVPTNEVIHVEPGTWIGIDGGTPFYDKWRENNPRDGEHPDLWSWSVLIAAANRVIHADNLENNYSMNDVRWGIGSDTAKAWRYYLQAETSCHWYWDFDRANPWDGNATRGANLAIAEANKVINRHSGIDRVGPTIWPPQRDIWNPGDKHYNEATNQPSNFNVYTFVDDVSGLQNVRLYWRTDNDGQNPIMEYDNELYAHNPSKNSAWNVVTMTGDWYPPMKGPLVPEPTNRAMRYQGAINGQTNVLIDYFVEATDNKGNVSRSDLDQVWVGTASTGGGGGGGGTSGPVTVSPAPPVAGQPVTVTYSGSLASGAAVNIHHGFNGSNWTTVPGVAMTKSGSNWIYTYNVATNATTIAVCFNNGSGTWDANGGSNWNFSVTSQPPTDPPATPTGLAATNITSSSATLTWNTAATASSYLLFRNGTQIATPTGTNHTDTGLTPETTYTYAVRATNSAGQSALSLGVNVTTLFTPLNSTQISILSPSNGATTSSNSIQLSGRAGVAFTNGLSWQNSSIATSGIIAFPGGNPTNGWAWWADIPLTNGLNSITISGSRVVATTNSLSDSPESYTTWAAEQGQGSGFGVWYFNHSTSNAGGFLATNATNMSLGPGSTKGFGLWANNGGRAAVTRSFVTPMKTGDSFNVKFDNNWITETNTSLVGLELRSTNGIVRLRFSFVGGQSHYRVLDALGDRATSIPYTAGGLDLTLSLGASNAYVLNTGNGLVSGNLIEGDAIAWIEFFNQNAGPDTPYNLYIGRLTHRILETATESFSEPMSLTRASSQTEGIDDTWWALYGITGSNRLAADDPDGDGFSNAQENALGTSPVDASSTFKVGGIERSNNVLKVTWPAVAGKNYQVQKRASLSAGSWPTNGPGTVNVTATTNSASADVDVSDSPNASFVRVILVP
jgi:hypothetical protein